MGEILDINDGLQLARQIKQQKCEKHTEGNVA